MTDEGLDARSLLRRPGSSRYCILPSIGQTSCTEAIVDQVSSCNPLDAHGTVHSSEALVAETDRTLTRHDSSLQRGHQRGSDVPRESHVSDAKRPHSPVREVIQQVLLAVKLPTGQRIEHSFQPTDKLVDVLHYVETVSQQDFTNSEFVSADRRTILADLNLTLASCDNLNHSVLYLQLPDQT